jgi:cytidylate kinase
VEVHQLLLFEAEKSETEELSDELDILCEKMDTLRKGLFKRHSTLASQLKTSECRIDLLEQQLYIAQKGNVILESRLAALETLLTNFMETKNDPI